MWTQNYDQFRSEEYQFDSKIVIALHLKGAIDAFTVCAL